MVSTQADCHMGGVELQASVLPQAPTPEDEAALRALVEDDLEAAAALGALLIRHFPKRGVIAAEGLLTRRALQGTRILNAFNHPLGHWVDLMCFVTFVNLCGSMSLQAMAVGGFAPVAAVTERLVHRHARRARLGTWQLSRIVEAGRVEPALLQKYVNQWVALSLDLFGWDRSRTAALAYAAGLKGRVHERERSDVPEDPTRLNDDARVRWLFLVEETLASLNEVSVAGPPLRVPPLAANRSLVADRSAGRGAPPADPRPESRDWPLPTPADDERLRQITSQAGWIKRA
jgi:benzoyl-CoA 2,3-dioxygenase component B